MPPASPISLMPSACCLTWQEQTCALRSKVCEGNPMSCFVAKRTERLVLGCLLPSKCCSIPEYVTLGVPRCALHTLAFATRYRSSVAGILGALNDLWWQKRRRSPSLARTINGDQEVGCLLQSS